MRNVPVIALLLAFAVLQAPGKADSQVPGQAPVQNPGVPALQAQPQTQPEMPRQETSVDVKDGRLSVDVSNADLGTVMNQIGAKLNIPVQVSGAVFSRKITTRFSGLEIERGIERLLSLAKENNYLIRYDEAGGLSGIELYADNPAPSLGRPGAASMQQANRPPASPLFRRRYRRYTPPPTQQQAGQPIQQPAQQPQAQPPVPVYRRITRPGMQQQQQPEQQVPAVQQENQEEE